MAIVLGYLLGVFLPVLVKYGDKLAQGMSAWKKWRPGCPSCSSSSVLTVGIPADTKADVPGTVIASIVMTRSSSSSLSSSSSSSRCKYDANAAPAGHPEDAAGKANRRFSSASGGEDLPAAQGPGNFENRRDAAEAGVVGDAKPLLDESRM